MTNQKRSDRLPAPRDAVSSEVAPAMQDWAGALVAQAHAEGVSLTGEGGLLTAMIRQVLQAGLEVEMTDRHDVPDEAADLGVGGERHRRHAPEACRYRHERADQRSHRQTRTAIGPWRSNQASARLRSRGLTPTAHRQRIQARVPDRSRPAVQHPGTDSTAADGHFVRRSAVVRNHLIESCATREEPSWSTHSLPAAR